MTQPNNVLNAQKHYDSLIEEAAQEYSDHNYIDECIEIPSFKAGAIQMAQWKDEQIKQLIHYADKIYEYAFNLGPVRQGETLRNAMEEYKNFKFKEIYK